MLTLIFISLFAIGLGPIPYIYPNEVFTIDMRPAALSISMFANWLCNLRKYVSFNQTVIRLNYDAYFLDFLLVITVVFQALGPVFHGFVFLIFSVCCLFTFCLLWFKVGLVSDS